MAANGPRDAVNWDLDWDELTGGVATPPNVPPAISGGDSPRQSQATPPPLPQRAFPLPAPLFPDAEPVPILPVQRLPPALPVTLPSPSVPPTVSAAGAPPRNLVRGQRLRLADVLPGGQPPILEAALLLAPATGQNLDISCFGLDEGGKLSDDRFFIFYNQKTSPDGALNIRGARGEIFGLDLARLSNAVKRLVFTASIDGAGSIRALGASRFELREASGKTVARYEFAGHELEEVKALMVAELYFKDGWRLAAIGQGFAGGLGELLKHFGGQEI